MSIVFHCTLRYVYPHFRGQSSVVLKPKSTEEVSQILSHCNQRRSAENSHKTAVSTSRVALLSALKTVGKVLGWAKMGMVVSRQLLRSWCGCVQPPHSTAGVVVCGLHTVQLVWLCAASTQYSWCDHCLITYTVSLPCRIAVVPQGGNTGLVGG